MADELQLAEPGLALFRTFGNLSFVFGRGQILVVDTGWQDIASTAINALRTITREPFALIVYTHGHADHVAGTRWFLDDAARNGHPRPTIWAHEEVPAQLRHYGQMAGWEAHINRYQFGKEVRPGDEDYIHPDFVFGDTQALDLAGERVELHHAKGETEDAAWVWLPERQAALVGDLVVSSIPNTGNPNKPQRYTLEWAEALETIAALKPRVLLPGHGPVYRGGICCELLHDTAQALRYIHDEVVHRLNAGEWPIDIIEADIELPPTLAKKSYLRPVYGCVSFIVRDVIRRYAGWWSGQPSELFPAKRSELAHDLIRLCGRHKLVAYTRALILRAEYERAVFLAEIVYNSAPTSLLARLLYADALGCLADAQTSFIARKLLLGYVGRLHGG